MNVLEAFSTIPDQHHEDAGVAIFLADCMDVLPCIKNESIDLIFADPPYNIGKILGSRLDAMEKEEYISWCKKWIVECIRVLKPAGTFYLMAGTQYMPYLDSFIDSRADVVVKQRIVWYYDSSGVQARTYFGSMYEPMLMIVKDEKQYKFNPAAVMVEAKSGAVRKLIDYRKTPPQPYNTKKVLGNVWEIPRVRFKMPEYENHPTQKPEKLLEIPILASTDPGDLVLDPFSGSFTTCAVARRIGRAAIGIELDPDFYKMGLRRLNLASEFNGEPLVKVKMRKTRNKSKKDHATR